MDPDSTIEEYNLGSHYQVQEPIQPRLWQRLRGTWEGWWQKVAKIIHLGLGTRCKEAAGAVTLHDVRFPSLPPPHLVRRALVMGHI